MNIVSNAPEVRTSNPVTVEVTDHLAYVGLGAIRDTYTDLFGVNAGHPASLHLRSRVIDGMLTGRIKITKMKNVAGADFFSLRLIGGPRRRTVYLRHDARVVLDGQVGTMADVWVVVNR